MPRVVFSMEMDSFHDWLLFTRNKRGNSSQEVLSRRKEFKVLNVNFMLPPIRCNVTKRRDFTKEIQRIHFVMLISDARANTLRMG